MISKREPNPSTSAARSGRSAKAANRLCAPDSGSSTPVKPEATISAPSVPFRAGMAAKSKAFSTWWWSRFQKGMPLACCAA